MNTKNATLITAIVALVAAAIIIVPAIDVDADSVADGDMFIDDGYALFIVDEEHDGTNVTAMAIDEDGEETRLDSAEISYISGYGYAAFINIGALDLDSYYEIHLVDEDGNIIAEYTYGTPSTEEGGEGEETPDVPETPTYTVTIADSDNGTATADPESGVSGTTVTVTAVPESGYEVAAVIGSNGETITSTGDNTYTFVLTADVTITVTFEEAETTDPEVPGDSGDSGLTADREFTNTITLGDGNVVDDESSITASKSQEVVISGDVTVAAGGYLIIDGKLTIEEGATLTIEEGGFVFIDTNGIVDVQGTLAVEAGSEAQPSFEYSGLAMTVSGSVYLTGVDSFTSTGSGISISGYFEVGLEATADLSGVTVAAGGEVLVNGAVTTATGSITVSGTLTIDSEGVPSEDGNGYVEGGITDMGVSLGADGTVVVTNMYGTVDIDDHSLVYVRSSGIVEAAYENAITLENVAGVTVTETAATSGSGINMSYENTMYISGTVSTAVDYVYSDLEGTVALDGENIVVSDDLTLGSDVFMTVSGALTVSGTVTATERPVTVETEDGNVTRYQVSGEGEITVTGKVTLYGTNVNTAAGDISFNASAYTSSSTCVYTTLETALDDGATTIVVLGLNHVYEGATIPVGTTVRMYDEDSILYVDEGATLTVSADGSRSAKLNAGSSADYSIRVNGTLVIEDWSKSNIGSASRILSDTYTAEGDGRTYTSIYNALDIAEDGDTVTVSRNQGETDLDVNLYVELDEDLTVPSGVTLSIPDGQNVVVDSGVTVTVDGTVVAVGTDAYYITPSPEGTAPGDEGWEAPGATVVNGLFLYDEDDGMRSTYADYIDGAYFTYAYSSGTDMYAIAPLESMPGLMDYVTSDETYNAAYIFLVGDTTVGDVDFSAYEGDDRVWLVAGVTGDLTASSITLGSGIEFYAYGGSTTGTIVLANGEVELSGVYGIVAYNSTVSDVTTSYIANYSDDAVTTEVDVVQSDEYEPVYGTVAIDGEVSSSISTSEYVSVTVSGTATLTAGEFGGDVTVSGSAVIAGSGVAFVSLTVTGDVAAAEDSSYSASANAIYVGVTADELYLAGEGSVSDVTLTSGNYSAVAYVSPNATYDAATSLTDTEYYAEDELVLTAYAIRGNTVPIDIDFSVENARFDYWYYDPSDEASKIADDDYIGAYEAVYAYIIYDIYHIIVVADSGIGSVAIGGNVLVNYAGNYYEMYVNLTAGTYEVTYTLASGYTDEGVTLTSGSEYASVSGMYVTLSGEPGETDDVYLYLSGTTATDTSIVVNVDNGDDGMSITDWLLVILVILIIIMAIIVALRLRRS